MAIAMRGVVPLVRLTSLFNGVQIKCLSTAVVAGQNKFVNICSPSTEYFYTKKILCNAEIPLTNKSPTSINLFNEITIKSKLPLMDMPQLPISTILPVVNNVPSMEDPSFNKEVDCPTVGDIIEKQAARLIVIRRRKMRIHKLKKLRKKMKYEWAKRAQRRRIKKEKKFQQMLFTKLKLAEKWSAEDYVTKKLRKANATPIPQFWRGQRLPRFIIRQYMGLDPWVEYRQYKSYNKHPQRTRRNFL